MIRTRFAPSPTGYLHIGGVRTALFSWAYAKKHNGSFVLRIEDTDLVRSTPESVQTILEGLQWLGVTYDEGPFYQTQRFDRYREAIQLLLESGHAYYCYASPQELDQMRAEQEARGEKPRYDRRWRPEVGKVLPAPPAHAQPVVRFKTPLAGSVVWDDAVKGRIEIRNEELDDLVIARSDGSPTYNFCVVVDDWDMQITHVIRGDDHVNNTPRQIHILNALRAPLPVYAHLPMILNADGQKMSKRRDAVSVVDYRTQGILPAALLNNLARLGWGHGDDEFFTLSQFVEWFDLADVSPSAARFNQEKLLWLNAQHLKEAPLGQLAPLVQRCLEEKQISVNHGPPLAEAIALVRDRVQDINALTTEVEYFYRKPVAMLDDPQHGLSAETKARLVRFATQLVNLEHWCAESIRALFKPFCREEGINMAQIGMPLRLVICGTTQTPSLDAVLALIGKEEVLARLNAALAGGV